MLACGDNHAVDIRAAKRSCGHRRFYIIIRIEAIIFIDLSEGFRDLRHRFTVFNFHYLGYPADRDDITYFFPRDRMLYRA